jgi:signal transduction histidine kinase/DNA-binding response OmpR family regulator
MQELEPDITDTAFETRFQEFFEKRFNNDGSWEDEFALPDGRHVLRHQSYRNLVGNIITTTDITDIKNAQLKAESAEKSKSEFLANMSHEIRTPMNGIMGMAQLLSLSEMGDQQKNFVKVIERSGDALLTIINDILDFSKIEAGQVTLDHHAFNLRNSIDDVIALLSVTAAAKGVEILYRFQPDLSENYIGDVGRIRQIMTNIIGNAVKFTEEGYVHIDVSGQTDQKGTRVSISVQDTGIGIPASKIEDVFDKFNQADGTKSRKYEGTGLGLSIAKEFANLMGGDVTVESEVGTGSCFTIMLRLDIDEHVLKTTSEPTDLRGKKILLINDDPKSLRIIKEQLSFWKCKSAAVDSIGKGIRALKVGRENQIEFDIVILNHRLHDEDYDIFLTDIQESGAFSKIPVLLLMSAFENVFEAESFDHGMISCLTKPYTVSALYEALKSQLKRPTVLRGQQTDLTPISEGAPARDQPKSELLPTSTSKQINEAQTAQIDVLVAEDNEINAVYISYVLEQIGADFKIVENGAAAVDYCRHSWPKLIFMDVSMPVMNGYDATLRIRDIEKKLDKEPTPIIAVTAHALTDDREKCLAAGMDGYLTKPVSMNRIESILIERGIIEMQTSIAQTSSTNFPDRVIAAKVS